MDIQEKPCIVPWNLKQKHNPSGKFSGNGDEKDRDKSSPRIPERYLVRMQ